MNSGTKTEVIDLEDSNVVCEDLEDFPVDTYGAVGGNLASIPIICGGVVTKNSDHTSDKCLKYTILNIQCRKMYNVCEKSSSLFDVGSMGSCWQQPDTDYTCCAHNSVTPP